MDQYEILFKGEVMPTLDPEQVSEALASLFKASPEKIAPLFNGSSHTLKSGLDREAAERYRDTLKKAGAIVYLRRMGVPPRTATKRNSGDNTGLSIAPMVGNLVRDEERETVTAVEVDTSSIALASDDGSPLQTPREEVANAPDTGHISIAETGADLNPDRAEPPPLPTPDIEGIDLAPADAGNLSPASAETDFPVPDTSSLDIEPAGEILKPHERQQPTEAPKFRHDFDLAADPDD